jgi:molybdopterin converting factor small subunit
MIRVKALYFGGLRARLGRGEEDLLLTEPCQAADAGAQATARLGPEWLAVLRYAVNAELVPAMTPLRDGDEVALLPPVSGG